MGQPCSTLVPLARRAASSRAAPDIDDFADAVYVRARITLLKDRALERPIIAQGGAVHFVGIGPNVEEATEDAARRAVDFAVGRTGLNREEAYMLLSIIGELRVGTLSGLCSLRRRQS